MKRMLIALLLAAALLLSSCETRAVMNDDGGFTDPGTGITYVPCSATLSLRPLNAEDIYIKGTGVTFYTIQWEDPKRYVCDYATEGASFVYRATDAVDITLANFNPIAAQVYAEGNTSVLLDYFYCAPEFLPDDKKELADRDDSALVYAIRDALTGGDYIDTSNISAAEDDIYFIRLLSQDYPGLYYIVVFFVGEDGVGYITNRATGESTVSPAELTKRMVG